MHGLSGARLRVFLADDHPVVLCGMKGLIAADPRIELVGEATDGISALQRAIELKPDVVVLDLWMPGLSGLEVAERFLQARPQSRVLVLTVHEDVAYLRKVFKLGISGYLLKGSAADELTRAIHTVAAGVQYLDPAMAGQALTHDLALNMPPEASELASPVDSELRHSARLIGLDALLQSVVTLRRNSNF